MPTATYIPLANYTTTGGQSSITFSSIPATYRDLVIIINAVGLSGNPTAKGGYMTLNASNGTDIYMQGSGSSLSTGTDGSVISVPIPNNQSMSIINIMDYSATDKHKTILGRHSAGNNHVWANAARIGTNNAITSVSIIAPDEGTDTFNSGCTFTLYGIGA